MRNMVAFFAAMALAGYAGAVTFPDKVLEAVPDISTAAAWGGGLPGPSEEVVFSGMRHLNVTASSNAKFGTLVNALQSGYAYTLTFDLRGVTPVPTLTFNGFQPGTAAGWINNFVVFKGGVYDFSGGDFGKGTSYYGDGRGITVSDGAVLTNVANMVLGYTKQCRLRVELSGNSAVYLDGKFKFTNNKTEAGNENYLKVTGGSLFEVRGMFEWEDEVAKWENSLVNQPEGNLFFKDYVEVSGENSRLHMAGSTGYNCFGRQGGSKTVVKDGGSLRIDAGAILWGGNVRNNLLQISDGGSWTGNSVYGGWGTPSAGSGHNRVEILENGTLTCASFIFGETGSAGNTLVVSNGTFNVSTFYFGDDDPELSEVSSNNVFVLQGPNAVFNVTPGNFVMFRSPYCEFRVEEGACYTVPESLSFFRYRSSGHDCTLRIRSNGVLSFAKSQFSTSTEAMSDDVIAWNNRLIAESGAIVTGGHFVVQGRECEARVDDATLVLTNSLLDVDSLIVGYTYEHGGRSTNCLLSVAGSGPAIRLQGGLSVRNGSTVRFELPEQGYDEGAVPIVSGGAIDFNAGCDLVFSGAKEMMLRHSSEGRRAQYVLMENPEGSRFVSDETIAAANACLARNAVLRKCVSGGRNRLTLRVLARTSPIIILR